ncbi:MAG TPA: hypothetical protein VMW64_03895 [Dehalococcoidia bacterium]|nr:hypothetical protein [Dehalococcoidia bacterium]
MRPKYWYCPFCGYMFMETGAARATGHRDCPMCGEECLPCWECLNTGEFNEVMCDGCGSKTECQATLRRR